MGHIGRELNRSEITIKAERLFWRKVKTSTASRCWEWTGAKTSKGYGNFSLYLINEGKRCNFTAHRVSYVLFKGFIPGGSALCILHKCDNRACVNPNHLMLGTFKDNTQDMLRKKRGTTGENQPNSFLKTADVLSIRQLHKEGHTCKSLSDRYSCHINHVYDILKYRRWSHVA